MITPVTTHPNRPSMSQGDIKRRGRAVLARMRQQDHADQQRRVRVQAACKMAVNEHRVVEHRRRAPLTTMEVRQHHEALRASR